MLEAQDGCEGRYVSTTHAALDSLAEKTEYENRNNTSQKARGPKLRAKSGLVGVILVASHVIASEERIHRPWIIHMTRQ